MKVFTYNAPASGRSPQEIAEDAFAAFNDAPSTGEAAALARQYRQRRLRSLSFPGKSPCCGRPCCSHRYEVWPRSSERQRPERAEIIWGLQR